MFKGNPTVDDPAVALYAVAPGGGAPRILSEPDRAARVRSGDRSARHLARWANGDVLELGAECRRRRERLGTRAPPGHRDRAHLIDLGWVGEPDQPGRPAGWWAPAAGLSFESVDGLETRPSIGAGLDVNGTELAFSPDGTQVLGRSNPGSALDGWFVMDIESGELTPLDVPTDATVSWQRVALP